MFWSLHGCRTLMSPGQKGSGHHVLCKHHLRVFCIDSISPHLLLLPILFLGLHIFSLSNSRILTLSLVYAISISKSPTVAPFRHPSFHHNHYRRFKSIRTFPAFSSLLISTYFIDILFLCIFQIHLHSLHTLFVSMHFICIIKC